VKRSLLALSVVFVCVFWLSAAGPLSSADTASYAPPAPRPFASFGYECSIANTNFTPALLFCMQGGVAFSWCDVLLDAGIGGPIGTNGLTASLGISFEPRAWDVLCIGIGAGILTQARDKKNAYLNVYARVSLTVMLPLFENMIVKLGPYGQLAGAEDESESAGFMFGLRFFASYYF